MKRSEANANIPAPSKGRFLDTIDLTDETSDGEDNYAYNIPVCKDGLEISMMDDERDDDFGGTANFVEYSPMEEHMIPDEERTENAQ